MAELRIAFRVQSTIGFVFPSVPQGIGEPFKTARVATLPASLPFRRLSEARHHRQSASRT